MTKSRDKSLFCDFKGFVFLVILYLKDFFDFLMNVFNSLRIFTIGSLCKFTAFFSKKVLVYFKT